MQIQNPKETEHSVYRAREAFQGGFLFVSSEYLCAERVNEYFCLSENTLLNRRKTEKPPITRCNKLLCARPHTHTCIYIYNIHYTLTFCQLFDVRARATISCRLIITRVIGYKLQPLVSLFVLCTCSRVYY